MLQNKSMSGTMYKKKESDSSHLFKFLNLKFRNVGKYKNWK